MGSGFNFFTNAYDVTPGTTGSWQDIDVSDKIPAGSTGVICEFVSTTTVGNVGLRKNGSTDDRKYNFGASGGHIYCLCGVDSSKLFEQHIANTDFDLFLIGYTKSPITFKTNADDISGDTTEAWTDKDITSQTEATADGAIIQIVNINSKQKIGAVRKNGSTDDRSADSGIGTGGNQHIWALVGLDSEQIFEYYIDSTDVDFYLMGYCKLAGAATKTKTYNADTLLKKPNIAKTYSSDVLLQKQGITKAYSADLLLLKTVPKTYSADVLLKKSDITKTYASDALLKKADITKTYSADLLLKKSDLAKTYPVDVLLLKSIPKTYPADVLLKKLGITKTYITDVILSKPFTGIIKSDLSMLERGMDFERKEVGIKLSMLKRKMGFEEKEIGMKLESLEREMKIEVVAE